MPKTDPVIVISPNEFKRDYRHYRLLVESDESIIKFICYEVIQGLLVSPKKIPDLREKDYPKIKGSVFRSKVSTYLSQAQKQPIIITHHGVSAMVLVHEYQRIG